jgi:tetratricopeptide (TPR) repeat protein
MNPPSSDPCAEGERLAAAGRLADAIDCYRAAIAAHPDDVRTLFAMARAAEALKMTAAAENLLLRVLELSPGRLEAVVTLANLRRKVGKFPEAASLLRQAIAEGEAAELWLTLGSVCRETGDDAAAESNYRKALALRPDYPEALGNLAEILADRGETAAALALYDRVLAAKPNDAKVRLNCAFVQLTAGNLEAGWDGYAARLEMPEAPQPDHGLPRWDGTLKPGLRLLASAEQGIGDQIMFAGLIPELACRLKATGGRLILACEPRLIPLFARSFPGVVVHGVTVKTAGGRTLAYYGWLADLGGADAFVEIGTLPAFLRRSLKDFPASSAYLKPDAVETARWRAVFAALPGPRIGLSWRSGKSGGARNREIAPLEAWADFVRILPGTPVAAQYGADAEEIARLAALSGRTIFVPPALDQKNDLDRTAAMLSALDGVVSAPTAVSWLAAASGTPVWKILVRPAWTAFGRQHEPFAPAARCIPANGAWAEAFAAVEAEIIARFSPSAAGLT